MATVVSLSHDDSLLMMCARWGEATQESEVYLRDGANHQYRRLGELELLNGNQCRLKILLRTSCRLGSIPEKYRRIDM